MEIQRKKISVPIQNAKGTADQKPADTRNDGKWITFWREVTGMLLPTSCNVADCKYKKNKELNIDGAHVIISDVADSDKIESLLQENMESIIKDPEKTSASEKFSSLYNRMDSNTFSYRNLKIQIRKDMIHETRARDEDGKPLFITPICHQCNVSDMDEFELKDGSILVPLYKCDIE